MSSIHEPIYGLHRDILWNIFSINAEVDPPIPTWYPPSDPQLSPLTVTRRSSQVCSFWRSIILQSPSIWANCLDLDLLRQRTNEWRREVLRRTGAAPLTISSRIPFDLRTELLYISTDFVDIISDNWDRVEVFDVAMDSMRFMLKHPKIVDLFRRPAKQLRVFSIRNNDLPGENKLEFVNLGKSGQLFYERRSVLSHFSITSFILSTSNLFPFPSILLAGQLQHLTLQQPLVQIHAHEFRAAFEKMPLLEELSLNIASMIVENMPEHVRPISLPNLKAIYIGSFCLDTYDQFLGHIVPHFGCRWDVVTALSSKRGERVPARRLVDEIQRIIARYMSSFLKFVNSAEWSSPQYLTVVCSPKELCLAVYRNVYSYSEPYFQTAFDGDVPLVIQKSFPLTLLPQLDYSTSVIQLRFITRHMDTYHHSLATFFLALQNIKELYTNIDGLRGIIESEGQDHIFFPLLRTVVLECRSGEILEPDAFGLIQSFFTRRHSTSPIEILNLADFNSLPFMDLSSLNELTGLKILWKTYSGPLKEYVCGSGTITSHIIFA